MAEFIIFWKEHYMDSRDAPKVASLKGAKFMKYERRYQKGDIIEVWPDEQGEFRIRGNPKFALVKVPGLAVDRDMMVPLQYQTGVDVVGNPIYRILKRRKWNLDPTMLAISMNKSNIATLTMAQFVDSKRAKT